MYRRLERSRGPVLGYEIESALGDGEYAEISHEVDAAVAAHASVRLLLRMPGLPGTEISANDDRFRFVRDRLGGIERLAVVGEHRGLEWLVRTADKLTGTDIKHFPPDGEDLAWVWVEA